MTFHITNKENASELIRSIIDKNSRYFHLFSSFQSSNRMIELRKHIFFVQDDKTSISHKTFCKLEARRERHNKL